MIMRALIAMLLTAVLAGCASGPAYRPATQPGDYGYRSTRLTRDQFRVSFSGADGTPRETVENFAMYRAAQITLARGARHFQVISRETLPVTDYSGIGPIATLNYGYGWGSPFWDTGIGYRAGVISRVRYETVLQIRIGPNVPADAADVYDARQVEQHLASQVVESRR